MIFIIWFSWKLVCCGYMMLFTLSKLNMFGLFEKQKRLLNLNQVKSELLVVYSADHLLKLDGFPLS